MITCRTHEDSKTNYKPLIILNDVCRKKDNGWTNKEPEKDKRGHSTSCKLEMGDTTYFDFDTIPVRYHEISSIPIPKSIPILIFPLNFYICKI